MQKLIKNRLDYKPLFWLPHDTFLKFFIYENFTIVKSKIIPKDGAPEIIIDWRVYTKNSDKPLIRDLIVEGLSLARTQKEEFSSILSSNNNDIKILISKLEEFVSN